MYPALSVSPRLMPPGKFLANAMREGSMREAESLAPAFWSPFDLGMNLLGLVRRFPKSGFRIHRLRLREAPLWDLSPWRQAFVFRREMRAVSLPAPDCRIERNEGPSAQD